MLELFNQQQQPSSPFLTPEERAEQNSFQHQEAPLQDLPDVPERNRGRGLRRAGNACEMCAGAAINSSIVFLFHWMQVHPVGLVLALATSHLYMTATTLGEGRERFIVNFMSGASAGSAALLGLAEPVSEWHEARGDRTAAYTAYQDAYIPSQGLMLGDMGFVGLAATLALFAILATAKK
ncbi:MAG: hypothetical protein WBF53_16170 [Litorimonas sp.]